LVSSLLPPFPYNRCFIASLSHLGQRVACVTDPLASLLVDRNRSRLFRCLINPSRLFYPSPPHCLVVSLPRCLVASLPHCFAASLPRCLAASLLRCLFVASLQLSLSLIHATLSPLTAANRSVASLPHISPYPWPPLGRFFS
jgi:hypothetical protein